MTNELGFKELYDVSLKTTLPIEVGGRGLLIGETIARFDKIQIANFQEIKTYHSANGGFQNRSHVVWEDTKEIRILLSQGVFSKIQMALMANAKLIDNEGENLVALSHREILESDENSQITLEHLPCGTIYVYDANTGDRVSDWTLDGQTLTMAKPYYSVVIDYQYNYDNKYETLVVGRPLTTGYLSLEGKTRFKDDATGKIKTGILKIPKLRLMSRLSMRLGRDAIPVVGELEAVAVPEGGRGQQKVMEIIFLNDDIDADM